jgi:hypothetical protein
MRIETMAEPTALDRVPAGVRQRIMAAVRREVSGLAGLQRSGDNWLTLEAYGGVLAEAAAARWLADLDALALQPLPPGHGYTGACPWGWPWVPQA